MKKRLFCLIILVFTVNLFGGFCQISKSEWEEDIEQFANVILKKHYNAFSEIDKAEFREEISGFIDYLPKLNDAQIKVQLARICARIGDSHTGFWIKPESLFPFTFNWFSDGIFSVSCSEDLSDYLGFRLAGIGKYDIEDVIKMLTRMIPHENNSQLMSQIPAYLVHPEILYGIGIIEAQEDCEYVFVDSNNSQHRVKVSEINKSEFSSFSKNMKRLTPEDRPDTYWETKAPYWRFYKEEANTMLVNYNSCRNNPEQSFSNFTKDVFKRIDENEVDRLVIDLRQNGGGNSMIFNPMLKAIKNHPKLNQSGNLYVLIGRRTFSSAILNAIDLKQETEAIFIGEPTGGKPNHFGEVKQEQLKNSGISLRYSTKYFTSSEIDTDSFLPDHEVRMSFEEYLAGLDMAFEIALEL